ncbi:MAG: type VI secretion system-associated FHA domain protein TagH [Pseudomonadota bacterium]
MVALRLELDNITNLPDGGPTSFRVEGGRSVDIGRNSYLDWSLPDPSRVVSGKHCEIHFRDGGYWLTDLSTNGTYLNGSDRRLTEPTRLKTGDRIAIGDYLINVTVEGEDAPARVAEAPPPMPPAASSAALWDVSDERAAPAERDDRRREATPVHPDVLDWASDIPPPLPPETTPQEPAPTPPPLPAWDEGAANTPPPLPSAAGAPAEPPPPSAWDAPPADAVKTDPADEADWSPPPAPIDLPPAVSAEPEAGPDVEPVATPVPPSPPPESFEGAGDAPVTPPSPMETPPAAEITFEPEPPAPEPAPVSMSPAPPPPAETAAPPSAGFSGASAAASPTPAAGADFERFAAALAHALDVPRARLETGTPEEFGERLGLFIHLTISGMQRLLKARATSRGYMRTGPGTQVQAAGNNPLKFMPTPAAAADVLFGPPSRSYLTLEDTLDESFADLGAHQMALYTAMQGAVERMLEDLEPAAIEAGDGDERGGFALPGVSGKKSKYWDTYKERFNARANQHDNGMVDVFMMCFSDAYARALDRRD